MRLEDGMLFVMVAHPGEQCTRRIGAWPVRSLSALSGGAVRKVRRSEGSVGRKGKRIEGGSEKGLLDQGRS